MTNKKLVHISGTILIHKDISSVFNFFADPTNDRLWRTEINKSILDGTLQLGVTVSEYSHLSKKAPDHLLELKCVEFDQNNIAVFETPASSGFYQKSQRKVQAVSDTSTLVTYTIDFDLELVKFALGFALPKFIVAMKAKSDMNQYLKQLKGHLEKVTELEVS